MANQLLAGWLYTDTGVAISGATVDLLARNTTTPVLDTTTTSATGYWAFSYATEGRFDVRVTNGSSIRWRKYDTSEQITALEVQTLRVRNPALTFDFDIVPAAITADRQLNLPLITGTDTLAVLGLAQTWTGVQTLNSPVFVTPALGTPASGVGTNLTGIPAAAILAGSFGAGAYVISTSLQAATIELGHATDTTLSRVSAGVIAVEGVTLVDLSSAQTLTSKTLTSPVINTQLTGTAVGTGASQVAAGDHTHGASATADMKDSVLVATTANITLSGEQTLDGVLTSASRVLVKNQTAGEENGIYVSAAGAWARATDADVSAEVTSGMFVPVSQGTVGADTVWSLTTNDPITLGTTALVFTAVAAALSGAVRDFLATPSSANLAALVTDETGSGLLVFGTSPTLITPALGTPASGVGTNLTGIPAAAILAGSFGAGAYVISTSLQAATIELGHATDTTLSRTGAGNIAIEGNAVYRAGGTDVPVADGGTGASTLTGVIIGAGTAALTGLALTALQSIRMNAGGTAYEGYTPAGSGADAALSNLAAVAINTALLDDAAAADDFGSATLPWKDFWLAGSSITPGTNNFRLTGTATAARVITLPDATGTLLYAGGALGTPASGTMTNVTGIPVSALANGTDGNLITWDANGVAAVVATGTAAQVLTSNGAGAAPTFQAAGGGAVTLLKANSGTSTTTAEHNLDTVAISGLAAGDSLMVIAQFTQITQISTGAMTLYNDTDSVTPATLVTGSLADTEKATAVAYLIGRQAGTTLVHGLVLRSQTAVVAAAAATFTTAWTGAWTLALRSAGQTSGGTHQWRWSVYKLAAA